MILFSWMLTTFSFFLSEQKEYFEQSNEFEYGVQSDNNSIFSDLVYQQFSIDIPSFKVDWSSYGKLNSGGVFNFIILKHHENLELDLLFSTFALFDVKITFVQFFFTW